MDQTHADLKETIIAVVSGSAIDGGFWGSVKS